MNKQKLIEKINDLDEITINIPTDDGPVGINYLRKPEVLELVEQLDEYEFTDQINEPQKIAVPQFVADFYESIKNDFEDGVYELCVQFYEDESEPSTNLYRWFDRDDSKPIETLVKMKLYGYEVKKEKLYTAKLKISGEFLRLDCNGKFGHFRADGEYISSVAKAYHFTRDNLVKYHIWGNDSYEINEVEE